MSRFAEEDLRSFLLEGRPDGPLFGMIVGTSRHLVMPTFVRGRDDGWFSAYCYVCRKHERFSMRGGSFHDPFTGDIIAGTFNEAVAAGMTIRAEWMKRRNAARQK